MSSEYWLAVLSGIEVCWISVPYSRNSKRNWQKKKKMDKNKIFWKFVKNKFFQLECRSIEWNAIQTKKLWKTFTTSVLQKKSSISYNFSCRSFQYSFLRFFFHISFLCLTNVALPRFRVSFLYTIVPIFFAFNVLFLSFIYSFDVVCFHMWQNVLFRCNRLMLVCWFVVLVL